MGLVGREQSVMANDSHNKRFSREGWSG